MALNRLQRSLRATWFGMAVNILLAILKVGAGIVGRSQALIADGVESLADLISSLIVWRGLVVAAEPADEDHPYGHGKAEPIAGALVAAMLLFAAIWICANALREIGSPRPAPAPFTLLVLLIVVVVKESLFRFVLRQSSMVESTAVKTDAWHHRSDAITSVAAAIGIIVALIGGKGFEIADNVAAVIAGLIIAWNGLALLRPALAELMDTSPHHGVAEKIRQAAADTPGVARVEKCFVRKMGHRYFVDMHVEVDPAMSVRDAHTIAHNVKDKVRESLPYVQDVLVHIEPAGGPFA